VKERTYTTEMNLPPDLLNLLHLLVRQVWQLLKRRKLLDITLLRASRNNRHSLTPNPQVERLRSVNFLPSVLRQARRDPLKDGLDRSAAGGVAKERGETAVGFGEDVVLFVDGEDRVDVGEDVGVVLCASEVKGEGGEKEERQDGNVEEGEDGGPTDLVHDGLVLEVSGEELLEFGRLEVGDLLTRREEKVRADAKSTENRWKRTPREAVSSPLSLSSSRMRQNSTSFPFCRSRKGKASEVSGKLLEKSGEGVRGRRRGCG
jgi:hypothetical protein